MIKQNRAQIYKKIVDVLREDSLNINQISDKTEIRWETVQRTIESLEESGFISKKDNKYYLEPNLNLNDDTYLGIPLTKEQKNILNSIMFQIRQIKPQYSNTFLQKAIIEVIKKTNIKNIPYGWYLYGECSPIKTQEQILEKPILDCSKEVKGVLDYFERFNNTNELLEYLYSKENNVLYLARLNLNSLFKEEFTINSLNEIKRNLRTIMFKYDDSDEKLKEIFEFFYSIYEQLLKKEISELELIRLDIYTAFQSIWELIGTREFYNSLKKFYSYEITPYYELRFNSLKEVALEHLYKLQEECPILKKGSKKLDDFKGSLAR